MKTAYALAVVCLACFGYVFGQQRTFPIITTIAGGNPSRLDTNGAVATNTSLVAIQGAALDRAGNFYFGEFNYGTVRRLNLGLGLNFDRISTGAGASYVA